MKRLKIVVHEDAEQDLEEIWLYTFQNWSLEQADKYHSLIFKEIEFLSRHPQSGKDLGFLKEGYWSSKVMSHLIFYKFSKTEILIIRILHENMDIPNRLND
jgi:toxin ParE1/3/4